MGIADEQQLQNTLVKLAGLEEQFARAKARPVENPKVRELTLRSLRKLINQFKEEIARYRAHATVAGATGDGPPSAERTMDRRVRHS